MRDLIDEHNEIGWLIAMVVCDLIEYEFVALGEMIPDGDG